MKQTGKKLTSLLVALALALTFGAASVSAAEEPQPGEPAPASEPAPEPGNSGGSGSAPQDNSAAPEPEGSGSSGNVPQDSSAAPVPDNSGNSSDSESGSNGAPPDSGTQPEPAPVSSSSMSAPPESSSAPASSPEPASSAAPGSEAPEETDLLESDEAAPLATEEEILAAALVDGAEAARLLNEYTDDEAFNAVLKAVLDLYYAPETAETYAPQLAAFRAAIDSRAADALARYDAAAAERADGALGFVPGEVIVVFEEAVVEPEAAAIVAEHESAVVEVLPDAADTVAAVADIPLDKTVDDAVAEFESDPAVAYAQPVFLYAPAEDGAPEDFLSPQYAFTDPGAAQQSHLAAINLARAWDQAQILGGTRVKVAILDEPFDFTHPDFGNTTVDARYSNYSAFTSALSPSLWEQLTAPAAHGTHVGGIIAASENNGIGGVGVASGIGNACVELMPVNVFARYNDLSDPGNTSKLNGTSQTVSSVVSMAIRAAADAGARVINMSLGGKSGSGDTVFDNAINYAVGKGCVVVCSAGNDKTDARYYPGDSPNAISVVAVNPSGNTFVRASYSNFGPDKDISAPGTVYSTVPNGYANMTGTSMAAPIVSGVAALLLYVNPGLTVAEVQQALYSSAIDLGAPGKDNETGWGLVNAAGAMANVAGVFTLSLSDTTRTLPAGTSYMLRATVTCDNAAADKTVTWSTSAPDVATVDTDGTVHALAEGVANITATSNQNNEFTAACKITVGQPVTEVRLNTDVRTVPVDATYTLVPTVLPLNAADKGVTWTSSNTAVATVSGTGLVKGVKAGTVTVTATARDGSGFTAACTVYVGPNIVAVELSSTAVPLPLGQRYTLVPTFTPLGAPNKTIAWTSSNPDVATVSETGVVTSVALGTATITATTQDGGKTATCVVTVGPAVTGVELNTTSRTLLIGTSYTLVPTVSPSDAAVKTVSWASSNPAVATVTSTGVVKGVKAGTVTVTCKTTNQGMTATCTVTVGPPVSGVKLNATSRAVPLGTTYTLVPTMSPSNAINKTAKWTSSNTAVATVDAAGEVKGAAPGVATITCTSSSGAKATCSVSVTGAPANGWGFDGRNWYFVKNEVRQKGWLYTDGSWYFMDRASGNRCISWVYDGGTWYYMYANGRMANDSWLLDGGNWYYLRSGGAMVTGWFMAGGTWYFANDAGQMRTGWLLSGNTWYYLEPSGAMKTGWLLDGNTWYYLGPGGAMHTGWLQWGSTWYYLKPGGPMATGTENIGGTIYHFNTNGVWIG